MTPVGPTKNSAGGSRPTKAKKAARPADAMRAPQQQRSEETKNRILGVVSDLVAEDLYAGATVSEIVRRADCSVGAFYGRFRDKDAALFAHYDARCAVLERKVLRIFDEGAASEKPLKKIISLFSDCVVTHTFESASFIRAEMYLASRQSSAPFLERARKMNEGIYDALASLLTERRREMTHQHPRIAALMTLSIIGGLPRDAVKIGAGLVGPSRSAVGDYKGEIRRAALGYLGAS